MTSELVHRIADAGFRALDVVATTAGRGFFAACGDVEILRNVPYGPDPAHRLDVVRPSGESRVRPLVVYVHGGAFRFLSKGSHWPAAWMLARAGFTVVSVDYRLAPAHPFPAALEDVATALAAAVALAPGWLGDPDRLVLAGDSAGANLIVGIAVATCFPRPEAWASAVHATGIQARALLPACGFFEAMPPLRPDEAASSFAGERIRRLRRAYLEEAASARELALADPVAVIETSGAPARPLPPALCIVGADDPVGAGTRRLESAFASAGGRVESHVFAECGHGFHLVPVGLQARKAWAIQAAFAHEQCRRETPSAA